MKKLLYCAAALATLFIAGSCQRENLEPAVEGTTLTYSVQVPGALTTKAIGDQLAGTYTVHYEVYRADEVEVATADPVYEGDADVNSGVATMDLEFVKDQRFVVLFWAQTTENAGMFNIADLRAVQLVEPGLSNNVNAAVFAGSDAVNDCVSASKCDVTLVRPISQLNIATNAESLEVGNLDSNTEITLETSTVKVTGFYQTFNVYSNDVVENTVLPAGFTYAEAAVPTADFTAEHTYVAMNYVGFAPQAGTNVKVEFTVKTSEGEVAHIVPNVPFKPNYRTNIVGNLITETSNYSVTLDADWADAAGDMEFVTDGLVKNLNDDYEVSTAKGLAYAINNLFAQGGDFYLTAPTYDLSAFAVVAPSIPAGVTLNIYGETPVVTRAAVSVAGVTITGLPNGTFIDTVADGGSVSITGVNLSDTGSTLVGNNQGTVVVSESTASNVVATGNDPVEADNVKNLATLKAALASDVKVIDLTADIEADEVILLGRTVTINGNDNKILSSANRAIRITASETQVAINDLNAVSSAAVKYPSDVRGISIDPSLSNVELTLNNCTVDFTDITANDWTYAVNVSGNGTGHKVTVIGGSYEGANVVNAHGAKNTITVKNATLTSMYPDSKVYYGACIWVLQNMESSVYAEGNTFNGYNAMTFNLGTGTTLVEKDNVDNTMFYYSGHECYYVSSAEKLQYLVNNVAENTNIRFAGNLSGDVTIVQKEGVNLVIDGEGCKYDGTITIDGNNRNTGAETLKITNVNFESEAGKVFISAPGSLNGNNERYSHNITVDSCTFTSPSYNTTSAAISAQKTYHLVVKNCTATNLHSLLQVQSCDNDVTVESVTIENCKSGISFGNTANPTLKNSTISANVYGVRADGDGRSCNLKVENTTVTAPKPIIVRKVNNAEYTYAAALTDVTLNATESYQVVFTNGQDDAAYVTPVGNWSITGADDLILYPRDVVVTTAEELKAASKKSGNIYIVNDITVTADWSYRTDSEFLNPVVINGLGHTIKFTGKVYNPNNNNAFRFENNAVVKNLTIDLSETPTTKVRAISTKSAITVDNCVFIGNADARRGLIFGEGASAFDFTVTVKNSRFTNWGRGLTDNENAKDIKTVVVENNQFTNAPVYLSAYENVTFTNNVMDGSLINITSYTAASTAKVKATGNTLDTSLYNTIGSANRKFSAANVEAQEGFIVTAE